MKDTNNINNSSLAEGTTISNTIGENYTKVPNSILKARNLDSDSKVVLALLLGSYSYAERTQQLSSDGGVYFVEDRFSEQMDIKGAEVHRRVIPNLERKGLIKKVKHQGDKKNYYIINWDAIKDYDGSMVDEDAHKANVKKGLKAQAKKKEKELRLKNGLRGFIIDYLGYKMTEEDRLNTRLDAARTIAKGWNYKEKEALRLLDKFIEEIREERAQAKRVEKMTNFAPSAPVGSMPVEEDCDEDELPY